MLESLFSVTAPASDLALLTIAELRSATGVKDNSRDDELKILGRRVNGRIARICRLRADGATPPTLRQESLSETFRFGGVEHVVEKLILARRPIIQVTAIIEDAVTLDPTSDYEVQKAQGTLTRLWNDFPAWWGRWGVFKITVTYTAGWATVPEDVKLAASRLARDYWFQQGKDPLVRQVTIPDVIERQYWVGSQTDPDVSQEVLDMLAPYVNPGMI